MIQLLIVPQLGHNFMSSGCLEHIDVPRLPIAYVCNDLFIERYDVSKLEVNQNNELWSWATSSQSAAEAPLVRDHILSRYRIHC